VKNETLVQKVANIVDNIGDISEQAQNMKLTRNEYLNCMREVTKVKIISIKEAREIFNRRIKKLMKAQSYEIKSQEAFAMGAAQKVFGEISQQVRQLFDSEAKVLLGDFNEVNGLIRYY